MKKKLFISLFILNLCVTINAQDSNNHKFSIEPFIGYSALNHHTNLQLMSNGQVDENDIFPLYPYKNTINYGLKGEYKLSNKIGLGIELNYSQFKGNTKYNYSYSPFGDSISVDDDYTRKAKNISLFSRLNYHFYQKNNLDIYTTAGIGIAHLNIRDTQTSVYNIIIDAEPNIFEGGSNEGPVIREQDLTHKYYIPVYKVGLGMNYSPFKNFGINFETGYRGTFFAQTGITYKFNTKKN